MIGKLKEQFGCALELCCDVVSYSRSSWYYKSRKDDTALISALRDLADDQPNRGFDNYYNRLKREGHTWSRNKVLRVYRELGLVRRPKRRKRLPEEQRKPLNEPAQLNEVWSMDFMTDSLEDGRAIRVLNIIDDCNRECLMSKCSISYPSERVIRELEMLAEQVGYPKHIRTDNGPEFQSRTYKAWCQSKGIQVVYSEPGKPMQNGYVERFNRTFREDVLDAYLFNSISQVNVIAEKWKEEYNNKHPHKSLGRMSPREYRKRTTFSSASRLKKRSYLLT
ncbi:MAG TPA: IS3 family transposase [Saprospiraceae bacterium]|nr:IS3 family transposase [Saprospiraceae bacterium]